MTIWKAHLRAITMLTLFTGLAGLGHGHAAPPAGVHDALEWPLGLHRGQDFRLANGQCADCPTIPQALFYFRDQVIAVPRPGLTLSGHSTMLRGKDDVRAWAASAEARQLAYPGVVWLGAPQLLPEATFSPDGASLRLPGGARPASAADAENSHQPVVFRCQFTRFFRRQIRARARQPGASRRPAATYTARTIWPNDFVIGRCKASSR